MSDEPGMRKRLPPTKDLVTLADEGPLSKEEQQQIENNPDGRLNLLGAVRMTRKLNALSLKVAELEDRLNHLDSSSQQDSGKD